MTKRVFLFVFISLSLRAERSSDLGLEFGRYPRGKWNAISDVEGVRVGHSTLIAGAGALRPGKGPVRTGVTVIHPTRDDIWNKKIAAGSFVLNGNGEATGLMWIGESGILETPIALTNTLSVGAVQQALVDWMLKLHPKLGVSDDTLTPIVMECDDSALNDIRGQHVRKKHVFEALERAASGPIKEGSVGAGAGMITYEFKGGIGTASRLIKVGEKTYTVGILLNANHGERHTFRIKGAPIGEELKDLKPKLKQDGSVVVVLATDAPLDGRQLSRLSRRVMLGIAKTGAVARHGSGDLALAFSTANRIPHYPKEPLIKFDLVSDFWLNDLFEASADAAEEALLNAMLAAKSMVGRDGNTVHALPVDRLRVLLQKYGVIKKPSNLPIRTR